MRKDLSKCVPPCSAMPENLDWGPVLTLDATRPERAHEEVAAAMVAMK